MKFTIEELPEKSWQDDPNTTSRKFKHDLLDFFGKPEFKDKTALELGCHYCHTSVILAQCVKHVYAIRENWSHDAYCTLNHKRVENVTIVVHDLYAGKPIPVEQADIVFIDAVHTYEAIMSDVRNAFNIKSGDKKWFVFNDYGLCEGVNKAINELCQNGTLTKVKDIGYSKGDPFLLPLQFAGEGIICKEM